MTEASPVVRLIDARPARFAPLGGIRTWPLCHRPLSSQMTALIVHSTIARPAFGRLPVIVPRLVSNVSLLLKHGRGVEHYLVIDRITSCNALFHMMGVYTIGRKKSPHTDGGVATKNRLSEVGAAGGMRRHYGTPLSQNQSLSGRMTAYVCPTI